VVSLLFSAESIESIHPKMDQTSKQKRQYDLWSAKHAKKQLQI